MHQVLVQEGVEIPMPQRHLHPASWPQEESQETRATYS
jgi:hypothetical protein